MTLLMGYDLETSNLDPKSGKVLEFSYVLKRAGEARPWVMRTEFIYSTDYGDNFIPNEAYLINGISEDHVKRFGVPLIGVLRDMGNLIKTHKVDFMVGHNCLSFDKPFLLEQAKSFPIDCVEHFNSTPTLDTMLHLPFPKHIKGRSLVHLAAEHGFINPISHCALTDVLTTLLLLEKYDLKEVIKIASEASWIFKAGVTYDSKERAKECGFRWESCDGKTFHKQWVRRLRESEIEEVTAKLGFPLTKISD